MQLLLLRILLVVGFCTATVGAAGFAEDIETAAPWMLVLGLLGVLIPGFLLKRKLRDAAHAEHGAALGYDALGGELGELATRVESLAAERDDLDRASLCTRVNELLHGPYFRIGSRNEDYMRALGNADYARLWDGFAVSERLLARAWSMATDGHLEEARQELPRAAQHARRAATEGGAPARAFATS